VKEVSDGNSNQGSFSVGYGLAGFILFSSFDDTSFSEYD